jgi:hypothetical protein
MTALLRAELFSLTNIMSPEQKPGINGAMSQQTPTNFSHESLCAVSLLSSRFTASALVWFCNFLKYLVFHYIISLTIILWNPTSMTQFVMYHPTFHVLILTISWCVLPHSHVTAIFILSECEIHRNKIMVIPRVIILIYILQKCLPLVQNLLTDIWLLLE